MWREGEGILVTEKLRGEWDWEREEERGVRESRKRVKEGREWCVGESEREWERVRESEREWERVRESEREWEWVRAKENERAWGIF